MAALAIFAHSNLSKTDSACQWNKPKMSEEDTPVTAERCFTPKKKSNMPIVELTEEITQKSIDEFIHDLRLCGPTGLGWILSAEPKEDSNIIVDVQEVIFSQDFLKSLNKIGYLAEKLKLSEGMIQEIHKKTVGQAANPLWLIARKHRITASNFGRILKACSRSRYPPSLFQTLTGKKSIF